MPDPLTLRTDDQGRFTAPRLEVGPWAIYVEGDGFERVSEVATLERHGQTVNKTITIGRGLVLRGRVVDSRGEPVAGLYVTVNGSETMQTDRDGRFTCERVKPTGNRIFVRGSGIHGTVLPLDTVAAGDDVTIEVPLCGIAAGRVVDAGGKPILIAPYAFRRGAPPEVLGASRSDRGDFRVEQLPPGAYDLSAVSDDGNLVGILPAVRVAAGKTTDGLTIRLQPAGWLRLSAKPANWKKLNALEKMLISAGCAVRAGEAIVTTRSIDPEPTRVAVPPGTVRVTVHPVGRNQKPLTKTVTVRAGETVEVAFETPSRDLPPLRR